MAQVAFMVVDKRRRVVVVYDDLIALPVAFAWCENIRSGVLEHGDEVGDYDGLGEEIFRRSEEGWSLPAPFSLVVVEIAPMTGP